MKLFRNKKLDNQFKTGCLDCNRIKSIKVLGSGCSKCHKLYEECSKAVGELKLNIEVEYITDMEIVINYGIMSMPALVVNNNVVATGRLLKASEIIELIGK